jgi:hypothetical protein
VTEEELRQMLKTLGWSLQLRARRQTGKRYAYAKRKKSGKVLTKYLGPEDRIDQLDQQTVESKLSS